MSLMVLFYTFARGKCFIPLERSGGRAAPPLPPGEVGAAFFRGAGRGFENSASCFLALSRPSGTLFLREWGSLRQTAGFGVVEFLGLPLIERVSVRIFHQDEAPSDTREVRIPDIPGDLMVVSCRFLTLRLDGRDILR